MGEKKNSAKAAHKALYRKYRSKSLQEIVGQEHITTTLENALKNERISHAYLFTGPRGTGKTSIARILAHEINHLPYQDGGNHLDIIEIDAASNRRIDDIRELRDKVHIAPVNARYKVYIIDEVHMLTAESFNALLKTLEEPPEHVVFILATTEVHKLPATIISRTQRHSFRLIPESKVIKHLKYIAEQEKIEISDEALALLATHGGGSFRDSISLLDQLNTGSGAITKDLVELLFGLAPEAQLENLLQSAIKGEGSTIIKALETLLEQGLTPNGVAMQLVHLIRNRIKTGASSTILVELMSKLLQIQNAQFPVLALEAALLSTSPADNMPEIAEPKKTTKPTAIKTITPKKTEAPAIPPQTPSNAQVETTVPKKSDPVHLKKGATDVILDRWVEILEAVKQKNNPLYTVLRLATPAIEEDTLLLIFSFPFHQKKIDEVKYKSLITQIIGEVLGIEIAILAIVDKKRAKPVNSSSQPAADPAHASLISDVQDIMGGGEIVNV